MGWMSCVYTVYHFPRLNISFLLPAGAVLVFLQVNPPRQPYPPMASSTKTFIVEHLDPELGAWSELEYLAIASESQAAGAKFCLSSLPPTFNVPDSLKTFSSFTAETKGVEELYANDKARVCLLDPAAASDLSPEDGDKFDVFLFGGILGQLPT